MAVYLINQRGYVTSVDDPDAETLGCLWELTEEHWAALDRYEGVAGGFYRRVDCEVLSIDSKKPFSLSPTAPQTKPPGPLPQPMQT